MNTLDQESQDNINHLIEMIVEQERVVNPSEGRYIPYEFGIPHDARKKRQIHRIDPSMNFTNRTDSYQCIGEQATREKIMEIVALPFTYKIKFCPYE